MNDRAEQSRNARRRARALSVLGALLALHGCAAATDVSSSEEEVSAVSEAIWNGLNTTEVDSGIINVGADPTIGQGGFCSGTLLRNQWVLTAIHCVNLHLDRDFPAAPGGSYPGNNPNVQLSGAAVDAAGNLVTAGTIKIGTAYQFHLQRFTAAGNPDWGFGVNGEVNFDFLGSTSEGARAVAIQTDGKIVAAGWAVFNNTVVFGAARFLSNGAPDWSFGFLGASQTDIAGVTGEQAFGLALDSQNRAYLSGPIGTTFGTIRLVNGVMDTTFGGGPVTTDFPGSTEYATAVTIDGNGKIVVVGPAGASAGIARYNTDGTPDKTFNTTGSRVISGFASPSSVVVQGSKLLLGGQTSQSQAAVIRLTSTGASDGSFGAAGVSQPTWLGATSSKIVGLAIAPSGAIRAAATLTPGSGVGYTTLTANGGLTIDRIYPPFTGLSLGGNPGTLPATLVAQNSRVFVVGTQTVPGSSPAVTKGWFMVLQPDRTEDTTFTGAFTVGMAGEKYVPDRAYYSNSGDDVVLLHLSQGVKMNGTRSGYVFPGFATNSASLAGTNVVCKGYGGNVWNPVTKVVSGGGFQLRGGFSQVTAVTDYYLGIGPIPNFNPANVTLPGDSGGSCQTAAPGNLVIGVNSRGGEENGHPVGSLVRADRFAAWANQLVQQP